MRASMCFAPTDPSPCKNEAKAEARVPPPENDNSMTVSPKSEPFCGPISAGLGAGFVGWKLPDTPSKNWADQLIYQSHQLAQTFFLPIPLLRARRRPWSTEPIVPKIFPLIVQHGSLWSEPYLAGRCSIGLSDRAT